MCLQHMGGRQGPFEYKSRCINNFPIQKASDDHPRVRTWRRNISKVFEM